MEKQLKRWKRLAIAATAALVFTASVCIYQNRVMQQQRELIIGLYQVSMELFQHCSLQ